MIDIKLSATHDLMIRDGDIELIGGADRVAQEIKITLLTWLGEWFLDQRVGVPYLENVLVKNPDMNYIRAILRKKVANVDGVKNVVSLDAAYDRKTRLLNVEYEAQTEFGLVKGEEGLRYGK